MGLETRCAVQTEGADGRREDADAKVQLEGDALIVRGPARVTVPRPSITGMSVHDGTLVVVHAAGTVRLAIGDAAEKWKAKIEEGPRSRAHKLGVKGGMRVTLIEVNDPTIGREVAEAGGVVVDDHLRDPAQPVELIITEIQHADDLARIEGIAGTLGTGALWVVHPNGDATVGDRAIFAVADRLGMVYTKTIAFSAGMSAERLSFRKSKS